jgi:hypothetical protein
MLWIYSTHLGPGGPLRCFSLALDQWSVQHPAHVNEPHAVMRVLLQGRGSALYASS